MAPESERAITHDEAMEAAQTLIDHMFRNVTTRRVQARIPAEPTDTDVLLTTYIRQQKEKAEPTLTCSEVVERLATELAEKIVADIPLLPRRYDEMTKLLGVSESAVQYEVEIAKLISSTLHSWREQIIKEKS
jgi:hypothetical protein